MDIKSSWDNNNCIIVNINFIIYVYIMKDTCLTSYIFFILYKALIKEEIIHGHNYWIWEGYGKLPERAKKIINIGKINTLVR